LITSCSKFSVPWKDGILKPITPLDVFNYLMVELVILKIR
jgi:hypothetical protein